MEGIGAATLVLAENDGQREFSLDSRSMWTIGRNSRSDIVLADKRVSRDHAIVQRTESGEFFLIDMGSLNGSYVNAARVSTPAQLRDGDRLSIGSSVFVFRQAGSAWPSLSGTVSITDATQAWFTRRLITVLVVDVRDFTGLTQRIDQALLCQTIGTFFRRAGEITQRNGVWALKYIGDAVMAIWLHGEDGGEERELLSILQSLVELAAVTSGLDAKFHLPVPVRIGAGINTGFASVGNTGSNSVADYTALGDSVNAAFRMESATRETGVDVVLGKGTVEALRKSGAVDLHFRPQTVKLKGYETPAEVWCAMLADISAFLETSSGGSATSVGRV